MSKQIEDWCLFGRDSLGGFDGSRHPIQIGFSVEAGRVNITFPGELNDKQIADILLEAAAILGAPNMADHDIF